MRDANLPHARIRTGRPDGSGAGLGGDANGEHDGGRGPVRVSLAIPTAEQQVLDRLKIAGGGLLAERELGRALLRAALGDPDLDPELFGREGVSEELLCEREGEGDGLERVGFFAERF